MSIQDQIAKDALSLLHLTAQDVDAAWDKNFAETGDDYLRYIRERQLNTELNSSTPEHTQLMNAQHLLTKLEEKALPDLKKLLPKLLAIEKQKERIGKIQQTITRQREDRAEERKDAIEPEYLRLITMIGDFGASRSKVRQLGEKEMVILADMICWKAEDPKFTDQANPWRQIFMIYQSRTIPYDDTGSRQKVISAPGAPPALGSPTQWWAGKFWRFDQVVEGFSSGTDRATLTTANVAGHENTDNGNPGDTDSNSIAEPVANSAEPATSDEAAGDGLSSSTSTSNEDRASLPTVAELRALRMMEPLEAYRSRERAAERAARSKALSKDADASPTKARAKEHTTPRKVSRSQLTSITSERALLLAEAVFDRLPSKLGFYWPDPSNRFDYDPTTLIPALEAAIRESPKGPISDKWASFLEAMRNGIGEEFIKNKKEEKIIIFAKSIMYGMSWVIEDLEKADLLED